MARTYIRKCKKCGEYTEHVYKGKEPLSSEDKFMHIILALVTSGLWLIFAAIFDDRKKFWECSKCGHIHKSHD